MSVRVVFVHGNPATSAVWEPLLAELCSHGLRRDEIVTLSPPGFGAPLPQGFGATVTDYRDWLLAELEQLDEPAHLVGQDWGGAHVLGAVMTRPELIHSWVSDVAGIFEPDYTWHRLARTWQSPEQGEAAVNAMIGPALTGVLVERGVDGAVAARMAAEQDIGLGRAILALYRSAAQPAMAQLGAGLGRAAQRPGLSILADFDRAVGSDEQRRRAAARAGAILEVLPGAGHWWMVENPRHVASVLTAFWSRST